MEVAVKKVYRYIPLIIVSLILASLYGIKSAWAASDKQYQSSLEQIEVYLNSITTLKANFVETSYQEGVKRSGIFLLSKPSKIKWEYLQPEKIIIIIVGDKVIHYNYELEELSHISVQSELVTLLTNKNLNLRRDVQILSLGESQKESYLELVVTSKTTGDGSKAAFYFNKQPKLTLQKILLIDDSNVITNQIEFSKLEYNLSFKADTFTFRDPQFFELQD